MKLVFGLLTLALALMAQPSAPEVPAGDPVSKLIAEVRHAIELRLSDGQAAKSLRRFKLSERLEDRVIEELKSEELESDRPQTMGEKTMAELLALRDATLTLPPPAQLPFAAPPAPTVEEQRQAVNRGPSTRSITPPSCRISCARKPCGVRRTATTRAGGRSTF